MKQPPSSAEFVVGGVLIGGLLVVPEAVLFHALFDGWHTFDRFRSPLMAGNVFLGMLLLGSWLKFAGRPIFTKRVDVFTRLVGGSEPGSLAEPVIESRLTRSSVVLCLVTFFAMSVLELFLFVYGSHSIVDRFVALCVLLVFVGGAVVVWVRKDVPQVRADGEGVTGFPTRTALRTKHVRWDQVATCEIVTTTSIFGDGAYSYPVFKDENEHVLTRLNLEYISPEESARFIQSLRIRFPRRLDDHWDVEDVLASKA